MTVLPRKTIELTAAASVAYAEVGDATLPAAVFVHGVFTNADLWRGVMQKLSDIRRCIAIDLPGHGASPISDDTDVSLGGLATHVLATCDALGIDSFDLVGNDTGGAVAQLVATRDPARLRTFTLTNCDTRDNIPPAAFAPMHELARNGQLAPLVAALATDLGAARSRAGLGTGFERPDELPDEVVASYVGPFAADGGRGLERVVAALGPDELVEAHEALAKLDVPTLLVWGTDDPFFELSWAHWLRDTIPGVTELVEVEGGKLFFPDERADDLVAPLRRLLTANA